MHFVITFLPFCSHSHCGDLNGNSLAFALGRDNRAILADVPRGGLDLAMDRLDPVPPLHEPRHRLHRLQGLAHDRHAGHMDHPDGR